MRKMILMITCLFLSKFQYLELRTIVIELYYQIELFSIVFNLRVNMSWIVNAETI